MRHYKRLTDEDKLIIDELCAKGVKVYDIAKRLSRPPHTIYRYLHLEEIHTDKPKHMEKAFNKLLGEFKKKWRLEDVQVSK